MELQLEELEADAAEDDLIAEEAAAKTTTVTAFERKRPARKPFPDHLPRERVVIPAPTTCKCCGGTRLRKLGETVTETLEVIPRQWKVIQNVREKMTCRDCETISEPPAPFHVDMPARDWPDVVPWRRDVRLSGTRRALPEADDDFAQLASEFDTIGEAVGDRGLCGQLAGGVSGRAPDDGVHQLLGPLIRWRQRSSC